MYGYAGRLLFVDLTSGEIHSEPLPEEDARLFVGGYGIGAKVLWERQPAGVDPLSPAAYIGIVTGPLTATRAPNTGRFTVVAKSPLTGGCGDANGGGYFASELKRAGFDGVFFTGRAERPVYLWVHDGEAELRDATGLWGLQTGVTEDAIRLELGDHNVRVACIGPAGEKLSLMSGVVNDGGRIAARGGLGAVMGAKNLKAVAARGQASVPVADTKALAEAAKEIAKAIATSQDMMYQMMHTYGTAGGTAASAMSGDSPVRNWSGWGARDFPNAARISDDAIISYQAKRYSCQSCLVGCGGILDFNGEEMHKPEYEGGAAFGSEILVDDIDSHLHMNDICNRYGLDVISTGSTLAWAAECFEKGILTKEETGGLDLSWGNGADFLELTRQIAERRGFGDILADGSFNAAQKLGRGMEYVVHVGKEEPGMHDPRLSPSMAVGFVTDATPARHTQGGAGLTEMMPGMEIPGMPGRYEYDKKAPVQYAMANANHVTNTSGLCMFGAIVMPPDALGRFLTAVTGTPWTEQEIIRTGERISQLRHAFNLREGLTQDKITYHPRAVGQEPLAGGPTAGVKIDLDVMLAGYYQMMGWEPAQGRPHAEHLQQLGGLDFVLQAEGIVAPLAS